MLSTVQCQQMATHESPGDRSNSSCRVSIWQGQVRFPSFVSRWQSFLPPFWMPFMLLILQCSLIHSPIHHNSCSFMHLINTKALIPVSLCSACSLCSRSLKTRQRVCNLFENYVSSCLLSIVCLSSHGVPFWCHKSRLSYFWNDLPSQRRITARTATGLERPSKALPCRRGSHPLLWWL